VNAKAFIGSHGDGTLSGYLWCVNVKLRWNSTQPQKWFFSP
jgi:hypothetical protein